MANSIYLGAGPSGLPPALSGGVALDLDYSVRPPGKAAAG